MPIDPDQRVEELFHQAADLPPGQRSDFLRRRCTDASLLIRVQTLLEHHELAGAHFLGGPRIPATDGATSALAHQRVGSYTLLRILGEGGMGTVFEAEEDHPRRRVALKLIGPGLMTAAMLRRFEYEAELLGRLEHPGIARIYH